MYDSLYGLATRSTHPLLTQHTVITGISIYQRWRSSNAAFSPRNDSLLRTAQVFNDSTDLSFLLWSSNCILRLIWPQFTVTIIQLHSTTWPTSSYQQRSSNCIQQLDRPQLPATIVQLHFNDSTIPDIDITHLAEDQIQPPRSLHTRFVIPTINRHFSCICYLAFVPFIVFGCHNLHTLNLIHLQGRHAYRLHNKFIEWKKRIYW